MTSTLEKLSEHALKGVETELERLLRVESRLDLGAGNLVRSSDFIDQLSEDTVAVKLEMDGAPEGNGVMVVTRRDAIRLAGKLLMLPALDINQSIADGGYDKEYQLAFGEIARAFVRSFIVSLPESPYRCAEITCRDKQLNSRGEAGSFLGSLPQKQSYYSATISLSLAGVPLDEILLLLPAIMIVGSSRFDSGATGQPVYEGETIAEGASAIATAIETEEIAIKETVTLFDLILDHWVVETSRELDGAFGVTAARTGELRVVDETFIQDQSAGVGMLLGSYRVEGPSSCEVIVSAGFAAVTQIGSIPGQMVESVTQQAQNSVPPDSDLQDGFLELTMVILSSLAENLFRPNSEGVQVIRGISALNSGDDGFLSLFKLKRNEQYLLQHLRIEKDGLNLGELGLLIPLAFVKQLELQTIETGHSAGTHGYGSEVIHDKTLLVSAADRITEALQAVFDTEGYRYDVVSTTSPNLQRVIMERYGCVFLIIDRVDEIALSTIIKISSTGAAPLVVASPQWTQSQVVKALRFGAADIVLTPLDGAELREKMQGLRLAVPA